jgi:O-antigen/teichoic acid export membrane protein
MSRERHNFLRHAAIYFAARGLPGVIAFLAIPLYSRLLLPEAYGKFALVVACANLIGALFFQGLLHAFVRFTPAYASEPARLKSTLLTMTLALLGAAAIVGLVLCLLPPTRHLWPVTVACWLVLASQQPFDLFSEYARARLKPWNFMALQLAKSGGATLFGATLIALGAGWMGALLGTALAGVPPLVYAYLKDWRGVPLRIDRGVLRVVIAYSAPLSATVALAVVIATSDRFLIAAMMGESAAGIYAVSADLTARTLTLLMMVVYTAMFPLAVRAWEEGGPTAARERMNDNAAALLAIGLPAAVGLAVLSGSVADCFLGQGYRAAAADVIPLIAVAALLAGLKAYHWDAAFQFTNRTIHQVWIVLLVSLVNIALNVLFIPRLGINGAGFASITAYCISIAVTAVVGRRHFALPFPMRPALQVVAASVCMAMAIYPLRHYRGGVALCLQVLTGTSIYAGALLAMNFLHLRDALIARFAGKGLPSLPTSLVAHEWEVAP